MNKKIIGILVCMLLFGTILPIAEAIDGDIENENAGDVKTLLVGLKIKTTDGMDYFIVGWYFVYGECTIGSYRGLLSDLQHCPGIGRMGLFNCIFVFDGNPFE